MPDTTIYSTPQTDMEKQINCYISDEESYCPGITIINISEHEC